MVKTYIVSGTLICGLFIYATFAGWNFLDPFAEAGGKPKGPGQYHK